MDIEEGFVMMGNMHLERFKKGHFELRDLLISPSILEVLFETYKVLLKRGMTPIETYEKRKEFQLEYYGLIKGSPVEKQKKILKAIYALTYLATNEKNSAVE